MFQKVFNILRYISRIKRSFAFFFLEHHFTYTAKEEMLKIAMLFAAVNKLEGDYLEFGVYQGDAFTWAMKLASMGVKPLQRLNKMRFYAFDSFEGLPPIQGVDAEGFQQFKHGQYSCRVDDFKKIIRQSGLDLSRVELIKGWYNEVLTEELKKRLPLKKAAIIYIDCDLYESAVPVLDFVTGYLQDGTVIIFDDWFDFRGNPSRGEQRAFREWLKRHPEITVSEFHRFPLGNGNSFIIHKNAT